MVLPKSKNSVGLGNSLMNDRFGKGGGSDRKKVSHQGIVRTDHTTGQTYVTNAAKEASWVKMRSVTEQGALDEFLSTAELAATDFTAEKMNNVKIIHSDQRNPYLLSAAEERGVRRKHAQHRKRLTIPRRPAWDESMTAPQLDAQEKASLLEWRRGLAELQETDDLLMTPFERNIEVWRQLWRVIERSDLLVQIVDARNPLLFRSADLEKYVKEVGAEKRNLLLVNKADMMTAAQRRQWTQYFNREQINFKFFSAHLAREMNDDLAATAGDLDVTTGAAKPTRDEDVDGEIYDEAEDETDDEADDEAARDDESEISDELRDQMKILTVDELEALFLENLPPDAVAHRKTTVGLVGYPNVGKSSTINALVGAKKVSVSSTPGKTKHFQTIHLSDRVILCDCPGLVLPNFATTKAELVCSGVLPIDQLREYTGPAGLVAQRIPTAFLDKVYGMKILTRPVEEGGTGNTTASDVLRAYARARGFSTTGYGQPDESRAARYVLKDYVSGKLLYCHPPPQEPEIDGHEFNKALYDFAHLPARRQAWLTAHPDPSTSASVLDRSTPAGTESTRRETAGPRSQLLDKRFFGAGSGHAGHLNRPVGYQNNTSGPQPPASTGRMTQGLPLRGQDAREAQMGSKRHMKAPRKKTRNTRPLSDGE